MGGLGQGELALDLRPWIEGLGQLLGNGTSSSLAGIPHKDGLYEYAGQTPEVYSGVPVETGVLRCNGRVYDMRRQFVIAYERPVLYMECCQDLSVLGYYQSGELAVRILKLFKRRYLCEECHRQYEQRYGQHRNGKQNPEPLGYFLLSLRFHSCYITYKIND